MKTKELDIIPRRAGERGRSDLGWLDSRHSFSFGDYFDPAHAGFRALRVINDDRVAPGRGFPTHPHRDMEIFSYVLEGSLAHRDNLGNSRILRPGQIQLMSAGSGVTHSESNPSATDEAHFLQVWIQPRQRGLAPSYTEWQCPPGKESAPKVLVISPDGREGSATIHSDVSVFRIRSNERQTVHHELREGRGAWVQVASGALSVNGIRLDAGDGAAVTSGGRITISVEGTADALLFDLA